MNAAASGVDATREDRRMAVIAAVQRHAARAQRERLERLLFRRAS